MDFFIHNAAIVRNYYDDNLRKLRQKDRRFNLFKRWRFVAHPPSEQGSLAPLYNVNRLLSDYYR